MLTATVILKDFMFSMLKILKNSARYFNMLINYIYHNTFIDCTVHFKITSMWIIYIFFTRDTYMYIYMYIEYLTQDVQYYV